MGKFFRLVQNEHIKIFSKISTWVLVILMVVMALGYNSFMKFGQYQMEESDSWYETADFVSGYQNTIAYLKETGEKENAAEIAGYEFMIKYDIGYRDWRNAEVMKLFFKKAELESSNADQAAIKAIENDLSYLAANDWRSFFKSKLHTIAGDTTLSAQEKELQGYYYRYVLEHQLDPLQPDWRGELVGQIQGWKQSAAFQAQYTANDPEATQRLEELNKKILIGEYRLKHNLESYAQEVSYQNLDSINFWSSLGLSNMLIGVVSMIVIIIAGSSIANEFANGTIKFLLINPVKRWKIFLSKYVTILSVSLLLVFGFFLCNTLFSGVFFGFDSITAPYIYVSNGAIKTIPGLLFILWQYLLGSINLIVMGTLAFAVSSLLRNSAVAIGLSVFAMLGGNTLVIFMKNVLNLDWARFFIFANTDLNAILSGSSIFQYMTVGFSLAVIAVHMIIFFLIAWDGFMRRESIS